MAGFKKPKTVDFIKPEEMPRTTTRKILHKKLREEYAQSLKIDFGKVCLIKQR